MEDGAAGRRVYEADQIAPVIAVLDRSERALAVKTPDFVQDRLQPDAVFVDRPELDGCLREGSGHLAQERTQPRLEGLLRLRIGLDMAWARLEEACAKLSTPCTKVSTPPP
jgi:hypothetical protein